MHAYSNAQYFIFLKNAEQFGVVHRLEYNLIHASFKPHGFEFLLDMSSNSDYKRLIFPLNFVFVQKLSYLLCCLKAVHLWHVEVSKYNFIPHS